MKHIVPSSTFVLLTLLACDPEPGSAPGTASIAGSPSVTGSPSATGSLPADIAAKYAAVVPLVERLRGCGVLPATGDPGLESLHCEAACLAKLSCGDLKTLVCDDDVITAIAEPCFKACGMRCADGTLVQHKRICDGNNGCPDGRDEANCESIPCGASSATYRIGQRCDNDRHCPDSEDEDCGMVKCPDGSSISSTWVCAIDDPCAKALCAKPICE